jgi:inositol oxygenase
MLQKKKKNLKWLYTTSYTLEAKSSRLSIEDDEAFLAPEINAFGDQFRDYDAENERQKGVEAF